MDSWLDGGDGHEQSDAPRVQRVRISPGDQLWELHLLREQMSMRYGWSSAEATGFRTDRSRPDHRR